MPSLPRARYSIRGERVRCMGAPVTSLERLRSRGTPPSRHTCPASPSGMRRRPGGPVRRVAPAVLRRPRICPSLPAAPLLRHGGPTCNPDRSKLRGALPRALRCRTTRALRAKNAHSVAAAFTQPRPTRCSAPKPTFL